MVPSHDGSRVTGQLIIAYISCFPILTTGWTRRIRNRECWMLDRSELTWTMTGSNIRNVTFPATWVISCNYIIKIFIIAVKPTGRVGKKHSFNGLQPAKLNQSIFPACHCHKIHRVETVTLKCEIWNNFLKNW